MSSSSRRKQKETRSRTHNWRSATRASSPLSLLSFPRSRLLRENAAFSLYSTFFMKIPRSMLQSPRVWSSRNLDEKELTWVQDHRRTATCIVGSISDYHRIPDTASILRQRLCITKKTLPSICQYVIERASRREFLHITTGRVSRLGTRCRQQHL